MNQPTRVYLTPSDVATLWHNLNHLVDFGYHLIRKSKLTEVWSLTVDKGITINRPKTWVFI